MNRVISVLSLSFFMGGGFSLQARGADFSPSAWCSQVEGELRKLLPSRTRTIPSCQGIPWKQGGESVEGRPLVFADFQSLIPSGGPVKTALVLSMVHADELTPFFFGLSLAHQLATSPEVWLKPGIRVILAPLVNPDGFFKKPGQKKTRVNARGVDLNRNFETPDWQEGIRKWKKQGAPPRRNPGPRPFSEPETLFQVRLIQELKPGVILSLHSPLDFVDLVGPLPPPPTPFEAFPSLKKFLVGDFFPGSLGNYGGRVLGIPTVTLELPSSNPHHSERYWKNYSQGVRALLHLPLVTQEAEQQPRQASR